MKPKPNLNPPPRPPCSQCGEDATQHVSVECKRLHLHDGHWDVSYRNGTRIETILCDNCTRTSVKMDVRVSATVEKGTVPV